MKVTIVRTFEPKDECFTDADTGRRDTDNRQAAEPVRVLPAPAPETEPEPEPAEPEPELISESLHRHIRIVLALPSMASRVRYIAPLLGTTDEETVSLIQRGDDYVLNHYTEKRRVEEHTKLAAMHNAWAAKRDAWAKRRDARAIEKAQKEKQRQASLRFWVFRNKMVEVEGWETTSRKEVVARVKHKVLSEEEAFAKVQREIDLLEKLEKTSPLLRPPIPDDVRIFVWRRDEGRCVRCGSQERIEFDHIIPLVSGGSNTSRNIQVLCERCNRQKGTTI